MNALTEAQSKAIAGLNPSFLAGLKRTVENTPVRGEGAYFSFGKDGLWSFGAEDLEVTDEDRFLIDLESLSTGFVCWTDYSKEDLLKKKKNEKLGARMLPISQGEVDYDTLPDHSWPWKRQVAFAGRFLNDPYAGKIAKFESSSGGGDDAFAAVTSAIFARLQDQVSQGVDPSAIALYPVVKLSNTHYMHKTYGKTYKPVFDIVGWATKDGRIAGLVLDAPVEEQAPKEEVAPVAEAAPVGGPVQRRRRG
jgi:hypothetical protein